MPPSFFAGETLLSWTLESADAVLCVSLSSILIQARWSLEQRRGHTIPVLFLVLLVFWLAIVFASFGLFAPANPTALITLFLCAVAVSGGIMLIEELDNPL